MPSYVPIKIPVEIRSSQSDVFAFNWAESRRITADFLLSDVPDSLLRVSFERAEIVRLLDEMPLSTETDTPNIGLIPDHLAYEVTGSDFWTHQSEALKLTQPTLRHYRFITGWTCFDVLSASIPTFAVIPKTGP